MSLLSTFTFFNFFSFDNNHCYCFFFVGDTPASSPGYKFTTETEKRASYHYLLETTNQLTSNGSHLKMDEWLDFF